MTKETIAGWAWHCNEHDTHGNVDTEDEAYYMANAHVEYFMHGEFDIEQISDCYTIVRLVESEITMAESPPRKNKVKS